MNPFPSPLGPEIDSLAALSDTHPDTTALTVAAVLGGLAGPQGKLIGFGDELQPVSLHLALLGRETERLNRLLDLLTEPARLIQESLRLHSANVSRKLVREMAEVFEFPHRPTRARRGSEEESRRIEETYSERLRAWNSTRFRARASGACEPAIDPWSEHRAGRRQDFNERFRHEQPELPVDDLIRLKQPNLLASVSATTSVRLERLLVEADQHHLLGLDRDGTLLDQTLSGSPKPGSLCVADLMSGLEWSFPGLPGFGTLRHTRLALISLLGSEIPRCRPRTDLDASTPSAPIWPAGLLLWRPAEVPDGSDSRSGDPTELKRRYDDYRSKMSHIIQTRRQRGTFAQLAPRPDEASELRTGIGQIQQRLEQLPDLLHPYCRGLSRLPTALFFALRCLTPHGETREWVGPCCDLANRALDQHLEVLTSWHQRPAEDGLQELRSRMVRKLERLSPCSPRDLFRTYPSQRKDLHEPVLRSLIADGIVERLDGGILRLAPRSDAFRVGTN
ncbi:MAG: hypothetical protein JNK37_05165 [Verrucomicrobiales bacterium]|nr:hypothetical protein [Verrucomicrobiales bacterium]